MSGHTMVKEAQEILEPCKHPDRDLGNIAWYQGLKPRDARRLMEIGAADANDRQNDAPTFSDLTDMAEEFGLALHGYHVLPEREDERITAEGVAGYIPVERVIPLLVGELRFADELSYDPETGWLRAWWD